MQQLWTLQSSVRLARIGSTSQRHNPSASSTPNRPSSRRCGGGRPNPNIDECVSRAVLDQQHCVMRKHALTQDGRRSAIRRTCVVVSDRHSASNPSVVARKLAWSVGLHFRIFHRRSWTSATLTIVARRPRIAGSQKLHGVQNWAFEKIITHYLPRGHL